MVGFSAVGSLREEVKPRDFVVAGGVVDWTKGVSCDLSWQIRAWEMENGGDRQGDDVGVVGICS